MNHSTALVFNKMQLANSCHFKTGILIMQRFVILFKEYTKFHQVCAVNKFFRILQSLALSEMMTLKLSNIGIVIELNTNIKCFNKYVQKV